MILQFDTSGSIKKGIDVCPVVCYVAVSGTKYNISSLQPEM